MEQEEWGGAKARLLKSKLASWSLQHRVHRFLVGEVCDGFLVSLSTTATEVHHCELPGHATHPPDFPDYHDDKLVRLCA